MTEIVKLDEITIIKKDLAHMRRSNRENIREITLRQDYIENYVKECFEVLVGACPLEIERLYRKKPHRCPVCDGKGKNDQTMRVDEKCHPCKGLGVLWQT